VRRVAALKPETLFHARPFLPANYADFCLLRRLP